MSSGQKEKKAKLKNIFWFICNPGRAIETFQYPEYVLQPKKEKQIQKTCLNSVSMPLKLQIYQFKKKKSTIGDALNPDVTYLTELM